jgi:hypothetical protein
LRIVDRRFASREPLRRATIAHSIVNHENIFLAKTQESESTTCACSRLRRLTLASNVHSPIDVLTMESTAAQAFPSILTFADADAARVFCFALHASHRVVHRSATRAVSNLRQLFLKLGDVFFDLLVYSE